jgi:hypothetical protein
MFPFRFHPAMVERKANKKTVTACPITAREKPIWFTHGKVNRVRRIGAFSWGKTKKLPWVEAIAAELAVCLPVKDEARKGRRRDGRFFRGCVRVSFARKRLSAPPDA